MLATLESRAEAPAKFTEDQAREYLDTLQGQRPGVRDLAAAWGWSKSTAGRFLADYDTAKNSVLLALVPPTATNDTAPAVDFDWMNDRSIVLKEQPETACYFNEDGSLIIRQRAAWNQEDDPYVVICAQNLAEFIDKIADICGVPSAGRP